LCSGASAADYYLGGEETNLVTTPSKWKVAAIRAQASADGTLAASFKLTLPASQTISNLSVIWAYGSLNSDGSLAEHSVGHCCS
jgi:hypothetical protein